MTIWLRYSLVFLAVAIGVAQLVLYLNAAQDMALGSAAQLMVPAMIAALVEGQQYAKREKAHPGGQRAWNFAFLAMIVATVLNVALSYAGPQVAPEFAKLAIAPLFSKQFLILVGLYAGGYLLANRFFYGLGAGNTLTLMRNRGEMD